MVKKGLVLLFILVLVSTILGIFYLKQKADKKAFVEKGKELSSQVKYPPDYLVVLAGDSMTEYLGNSDELRVFMSEHYPGKTFDFLNYGFGSTNILSLPDRLVSWTDHGRPFKPILDIPFNMIIIESFGHNPLSEFPLEEGLKKQSETLDIVVEMIKNKKPEAKIVFLATISPNKKLYAGHLLDLSPEQREIWAKERTEYIKNHIKYANDHSIPLVNVFEKSLDLYGDGNLKYIEDHNYIHPSPAGIIFISREIADFIYKNNLLP
ncbi:hypothetical protein A3F00_05505 [Candidatus Daviesbacteria bacterium RIFCSPHIGHO2_12_FULL_37_11]|uniref:SGNH hydrolase-type esterase domain-containing protein n=1 Tax=Candidatus Daviesbacteria bacterium RIFCSPHIGHO2_12_FULL_37_11 TaxID=1797777 RepID=A0A1F5KC44_9BACT|nr:MAG: hypothetical protein A2111_00480 [Candidatus Daviesbacteria bacterium GWA1_38_6]OGE16311.1 MAG: hypothetical protein A2769_04760 [Candidatus Daviesbacteria bacterium RIFCSPHIGHO2_01_FULL_37_27]OGE38506.1 MAG: hypothetical protein A3F00_05505 [Candidatus Daviesbacteria bacterium RIFCSPHIGHO2_12_FULL_37_11]OGE45533.1 MAG: hypothetical protein A3B39_04960 [Candidatus Daviesbacteria bacterium RIFCSPLOWO2_01_FULL_37_10]